MKTGETNDLVNGVAIIGMAGRFPGARNVAEFWKNQREGVESISQFSLDELEAFRLGKLAQDPSYIRARSILEDVDQFDAAFFGVYPKEAELMDPQHRVFLECCWEALEDAGYDPLNSPGLTGVYAGASPCTYLLRNVCSDRQFIENYVNGYQVQGYPVTLGSNGDFLATRVSYKLNLKGPSFTVLSACSTSLLAVAQACQGLETFQCDVALAGGVSITFPQKRGYLYQEGGMVSQDGHCRAFDEQASGTVFGSGAGVVVLKRLEDALSDGDHIYAVIRGSAVNNDGMEKVGYSAPSVKGQANVIAMAQAMAGVDPETITYIEAHGTATPLGDPIEVAALIQAFRAKTQAAGFCALGTAKTNVGHLDIAAGITGLLNAAGAIKDGLLPPTLHFRRPNPKLNLEGSPFYVNDTLREWRPKDGPRRAGVSAFGVGGTNVHVILEEAPPVKISSDDQTPQVLILSAKSEAALEQATVNLADHLGSHQDLKLAEVGHTLRTGRHHFEYRRAFVASDLRGAVEMSRGAAKTKTNPAFTRPTTAYLFPGQGAQYTGMGSGLYKEVPLFRKTVDQCAEIVASQLGCDIRTVMFPSTPADVEAAKLLVRTEFAQTSIFTIEYALAKLWQAWGIEPGAMIGHSVGEFVAACIAGVFSLEDGLSLVAARGQLMQTLPEGAMLSVRMPEREISGLLNGSLSLAAVNSRELSVVAGPLQAVASLEAKLEQNGVAYRRLSTSHAFHSSMMDSVIEPFSQRVRGVRLKPPTIPYVSTVTGTWITPEQAIDANYWGSHLRKPVRFSDAILEVMKASELVLLEVGPGTTLSTLARQHAVKRSDLQAVSSFPVGDSAQSDLSSVYQALGSLWSAGVEPDWAEVYSQVKPRRVSLPTYPFERKRFWIDPPTEPDSSQEPASPSALGPSSYSDGPKITLLEKESPHIMGGEMDRRTRIQAVLSEILEDLSGANSTPFETNTTFLDMGLDSLFLTQVTQAIRSKLSVKITLRQLLDQQSTLQDLTEYIDRMLPPDAFPPPAPAPSNRVPSPLEVKSFTALAASPAMDDASAPDTPVSSALERIVKEQLQAMTQLMSQQLEMLRGTHSSPAGPIVGVSAAAVSATMTLPARPSETGVSEGDAKPFGPFRPALKTSPERPTTEQERQVTALIERYTRRTAGSKKVTQDYRKVLSDPRAAAGFRAEWKDIVYPIVTVRSRGSRLWDVDGNEYIDLVNGFGPILFGHLPEFVSQAVKNQLEQGIETGPQSPLAGEVAQMICELTGMERATFCNTGSEAVMAAIRVARTVTGRTKIVTFTGSYHGTFDEVLVRAAKTKAGVHRSTPVAPGIPQEKVDNVFVLEYGAPESLVFIQENAQELAAVLVEPVQSRHPDLQPVEFVRKIRAITKSSGAALILDEVVTGFRVHPGGIQALWNVRADMATYGKVLGGGFPIGVLAGSAEYMDALDGGAWAYGDDSGPDKGVTFFAGTFVRHPLALAACQSVLKHLKSQGPGLQEGLNARTAKLVKHLNEFFDRNHVGTQIEQFASMFYISMPADQHFGSLLFYYLREKGIHIQEHRPCFLTTAHSDADIQQIIQSFQEAIHEMQAAGLLKTPAGAGTGKIALAAKEMNGQASLFSSPNVPAGVSQETPLTESQLEVLLSAQMSVERSCCFNESTSLRMRGELDESVLRGALQNLFNRHQALRATFNPHGEFQHFAASIHVELPILDLTNLAVEDREPSLQQIVDTDVRLPFDLLKGPAVRTQLVKLDRNNHVLLFTAHHIVCDGWSTNVIFDELSQMYSAQKEHKQCALPAPMSFEEYTAIQAKHLQSTEGTKVEDYWVNQFKEPVPLLDLPLDRPRPTVKSFEGATHRRRIPAETYLMIKKAGAQQKATLFVTLLAGFQALLSRLSGQEDIVVGIPAAGQSLLDDQVLVGHCVNFLPLRGGLRGDPSISEYIQQVKQTLLDAYDHQNYTYGRLIRKLSLPRDPSRLPLIEVQFNLERVGTGLKFSGIEADLDPNPKAFVNHDLFLNIIESKDGLILDCDYNTRLFDEATIDRWLGHYITLLEALSTDANQRVSMLPLLTKSEEHLLAVEWNNTQSDYPKGKCVHQCFEEQALLTPHAIAAVYEDQQLTYEELSQKSSQLAGYLRKVGVRPGVMVAVFVDRSLDMIVGLLGVMKAGGAYVPMDPTYPAERISFILEDANVPVLLTQKAITQNLAKSATRIVYLDSDWSQIEREGSQVGSVAVSPNDLAYVIYTSGSTGKPKGVEIPHRAVVNLLFSMSKRPGFSQRDTLLAVTTLSFDIAGLELFLPLCVGAKLVIASREAAADGGRLMARLESSQATVIQATPVTFRFLIEAGWNGGANLKVLCGGEALPRELANQISERVASLWNMYGPTETTIWSSTIQIHSGKSPVTIGPPIDNTQFHVLDRCGQLTPIGVPGELHIGGDGLARGYFRRPELTAEKFVHGQIFNQTETRLYKTGDLVRRLPDGTFEFLGRLDFQVKLRGFRIELGEIEAALARYPGVGEAVVVLREDIPGDKRLVAYLTSDQQAITVTALREFLNGKIPNYMLPAAVIRMDRMPLTPNGKVDRRALPAPDAGQAAMEREYIAPRSPQEKALADIWAEVLRLERVGVQDNLFELGADSLHIFQIAARANKVGISLAPAQFLKYRTITSLLAQLDSKGQSSEVAAPIVRVAREKYRVKQPAQ